MQTDVRTKPIAVKANHITRRNEIIAIALLALGLLMLLCLLPVYSYSPDDASWNSAGQSTPRHNLIGAVGANVAAGLFQPFGLAAFSVPLLLLLMAWQRFRARSLNATFLSISGLVIIVLSSSALLDIFQFPLPFDAGFRPGGFVGSLFAGALTSGLNNVGAGVLLLAVMATGILLISNFSFAAAYDRFAEASISPINSLNSVRAHWSEGFHTWRLKRREQAEAHAAARQAAHAAREQEREAALQLSERVEAERVAQLLNNIASPEPEIKSVAQVKARAITPPEESPSPTAQLRAKLAQAEAELAAIDPFQEPVVKQPDRMTPEIEADPPVTVVPSPTGRALTTTGRAKPVNEEESVAAEIEEMVSGASVVRTTGALHDELEAAEPNQTVPTAAERAATRLAEKAAALEAYKLPGADFLHAPPPRHEQAEEVLRLLATQVAEKCREFNVTGKIEYICPGPVVTTYEFKPDPGIKYSRVTGLVDDLCLGLKAESIRIDRVPGKAHVGIEVPNPQRETIMLREVIESNKFRESTSKLTIALGKTIDGLNYVADLAKMPHLLIAGATGAGKSVGVNALIVSILYKASPTEVKFIMVDPKRLELGLYADIPHLATPIITDPKRAAQSLKWAVAEMERRYKELAGWGVRNIDGFNAEIARRNAVEDFDDDGNPWKTLPYIVIIIDELADLMMVSGHEVEEAITRLAQMARAVGIHLVLATQRPSVDVITGIIKSNFPSRIAYRVSSKVDSRVIIDSNGAEQLLGRGDMLFLPPGTSRLVRVHGAYVDETEISKVVKHIKAQAEPLYDETITLSEEEAANNGTGGERDELFDQALRICVEMKRASTSVLQRRLRIGYGRAAAILDTMEREGFIGQADGARPRPVLGRGFETVAHWDDQSTAAE